MECLYNTFKTRKEISMITVLLGKSGTGKSTIEEAIVERHNSRIERIISDTTRDKRDYEIDGFHYNFLSKEQFLKGEENGAYIESSVFNGWYYGINKNNIDLNNKEYICVTSPKGYYSLKKAYGDNVRGIMIKSTLESRKRRYFSRDGFADANEWERRVITDNEDFYVIDYDKDIHVVWNYDGKQDETLSKVEKIIFHNGNNTSIEVKGAYSTATIFTDSVEKEAIGQLIQLCNQQFTDGLSIKAMPDIHSGKGCTIGTTMTIKDKIVPNLVGVDIGCGMVTYKLKNKTLPTAILDGVIKNEIPSGFEVRENELYKFTHYANLDKLKCKKAVSLDRAKKSLGSLGGGNHFIEVSVDSNGCLYLIIHTGSRNLGKQVCDFYQEKAIQYHKEKYNNEIKALIEECKSFNTAYAINKLLEDKKIQKVPDALAYLEGQDFDDYIHDMKIVQRYAELNREAIGNIIITKLGLDVEEYFHTTHNYIDTRSMILRKGAVSSLKGETILIPINMRDGSLLCKGKGNPDWNYSAPHGAGRVLSRSKAKELISMNEFKESMNGIYTTSISQTTIDEAPQAYKDLEDIKSKINDTVEIVDVLKPIYNYKAH